MITLVAAFGLITAACTADDDQPGTDGPAGAEQDGSHQEGAEPEAEGEPCGLQVASTEPVDTGSAATDVLRLSSETFACAPAVVVADGADVNAAAAGAQLAAAVDGPMLLPHADLDAELQRLEPTDVYLVGDVEAAVPDGAETHRLDAAQAGGQAAETLGVAADAALPPVPDATTVAEALNAVAAGDRVVLPQSPAPEGPDDTDGASDTDGTGGTDGASDTDGTSDNDGSAEQTADGASAAAAEVNAREVLAAMEMPSGAETVWLVEASDPAAALSIATLARPAGAAVLPVDGDSLIAHAELEEVLAGDPEESVRRIGTFPGSADWALHAIASGRQLPGGGYELFPDDLDRRFIAFYGHPETGGLGALGQQDGPESTLERMRPLLEEYEADGAVAVPTFNPIVTVAHNGGSTDQPAISEITAPRYVNYSTMHPVSTFREWADYAAEIDGYVVMDFQPGRNDFLYQVQHYEELIRLPHVGIALDPEWRLGPNQRHLQQIGTVDAAELNTVIEWVADLVRDEGLPQKLIMIHQFQLRMIENREDLIDRDEVALVIQMDGEGQGSYSTKEETWNLITEGTGDAHWHWGWKNFFERDHPDGPPSPGQTMDREPQPVYVSYQ